MLGFAQYRFLYLLLLVPLFLVGYGVWRALRARRVRKFGDEALSVIEKEPEKLAQIRGIGLSRARSISEEYRRQANLKKLVLLLNESGVQPVYAVRFFRFFGDRSREMLKENPYLLTMDGVQAPFGAADRLAEELDDAYTRSGNGPGISYHLSGMYFRLDHIFVSPNIKAYGAKVDNTIQDSDHYPIYCFINLE